MIIHPFLVVEWNFFLSIVEENLLTLPIGVGPILSVRYFIDVGVTGTSAGQLNENVWLTGNPVKGSPFSGLPIDIAVHSFRGYC